MIGFGSSDHLAAAYGIAVTGTLAIDTLLFFFVVRALVAPAAVAGASRAARSSSSIDLAFFGANLPKVLHGGWFPLVVAVIIFTVLVTWQNGRAIVTKRRRELEGPLSDFVEEVRERDDVFRAAAHRRVPQRQPRHHAARPAREPRAQPHGARDRGDRLARGAQRAARAARQADQASTTSATRTTASAT